ncbi:MAG: threonine/serine dehydratase [Acidobacteria bacterium]|nr:threonine/serine dehydratase [Acidobacteriota bacterium]
MLSHGSTGLVSLEEIEAAAERIRSIAVRTPLLAVGRDGGVAGGGFSLKCESFQPMGAFKIRGAANMLARLGDATRRGVITYSSGNHGQAVALAAQCRGISAVVVMPETASRVKVDAARRYGAEVTFAGTTSLDRKAAAEAIAAERGLTMVPPFDHPWIVAGAGTVGLEILAQHPSVTEVYVPMGGGGLVAGVSAAIKLKRPDVRMIGVEPSGAAKMTASRAAGQPVTLPHTASIADGLLALRPGELTFAHVQAFVDEIVTVSEDAIRDAIGWLFSEARLVAEPSGAVATAGVLAACASARGGTVAVLSGGNVSAEDFASYLRGR